MVFLNIEKGIEPVPGFYLCVFPDFWTEEVEGQESVLFKCFAPEFVTLFVDVVVSPLSWGCGREQYDWCVSGEGFDECMGGCLWQMFGHFEALGEVEGLF